MNHTAVNATLAPVHCRVCRGPVQPLFDGQLLADRARYDNCAHSGHVRTGMPHWLDEAFNHPDIGTYRPARCIGRRSTWAAMGRAMASHFICSRNRRFRKPANADQCTAAIAHADIHQRRSHV